ncbi:hypothetical protein [Streptomyces fumanus]|uniref:Uncharacterized protein n=1 Tax=Streptomyces fumanus TaxID=67302 RepID=A0A919ADQ4_9ACTN|nr:hypothetical protein [Streptomyces fumanus]GHF00757.1 hypothetical protein GCM10018772_26770 [Streptomyces fumanus]
MFQDSPIYDRLIAERGDVPALVRGEAERLRRELEVVMRPLRPSGARPMAHGNTWQRTAAMLPGPRPD